MTSTAKMEETTASTSVVTSALSGASSDPLSTLASASINESEKPVPIVPALNLPTRQNQNSNQHSNSSSPANAPSRPNVPPLVFPLAPIFEERTPLPMNPAASHMPQQHLEGNHDLIFTTNSAPSQNMGWDPTNSDEYVKGPERLMGVLGVLPDSVISCKVN